ncbi:MAG TPA: alpha/beta hydrolase, partial [Thiomicrospira sp.]|nr:alpha/beta hydrolase [Thiomicrospira sp.]
MYLFKLALFGLVSLILGGCQSNEVKPTTNTPEEIYYAYLNGGQSKTAVILCHGKGKYPTWKVVDPLRKEIHSELGFHTLALQMPKGDIHWEEYADFFPQAHAKIAKAIEFLKTEKGVETVYLMGHSMGSRMASSFKPE